MNYNFNMNQENLINLNLLQCLVNLFKKELSFIESKGSPFTRELKNNYKISCFLTDWVLNNLEVDSYDKYMVNIQLKWILILATIFIFMLYFKFK